MSLTGLDDDQDDLPAGIGHNAPPPEPEVEVEVSAEDKMRARTAELVATANVWLGNVTSITDEDTASAARGFATQLDNQWDDVEAERKRLKAPHDKAAAEVQERFKPELTKIEVAQGKLKLLVGGWLKREKDRLAAEKKKAADDAAAALKAAEEAREAAQTLKSGDIIGAEVKALVAEETAATAAAAAQTAAKAKPIVHSQYGGRGMSLRTTWSATIDDHVLALRHFRDHPTIKAAVQELANAEARAKKLSFDVPGCTVKSEEKAV